MVDLFLSRIACNTYILFNEKKEGILVDPGYNKNNSLLEHISKIGVDIKAILLTHAHYDHIDALEDVNKAFPEAITYISEDEYELLIDSRLNLSRFREDDSDKILEYSPKNLVKVHDGEKLRICGYEIEVIATPVHTKGSCCYYVASEKALFSGDTLFYTTIGRCDLPTGSSRTIESSLAKLAKLDDEVKVYPGHGITTSMKREKNYNSYLRNI